MTSGAPRPRSGIMRGMPTIHRLLLALGLAVLVCAPASAEVTRLEIVRREVVLNGKAFGAIGICIRMRPSGTSHCHPIHSNV